MPFSFQPLKIPEVILVEAKAFPDDRGFFMETYKQSDFAQNGIPWNFVQDNYSRSSQRGVLRGLHYQMDPKAQGKLVLPIHGEIFDVAVDIRKGSRTYGEWVGVELSEENHRMLYIPAGFAHGFIVLSSEADVTYRVTAEYAPEVDRGILWNDPELGITWPIDNPLLSPKDEAQPLLKDADNNFEFQGDEGA
jgi:dTDP-4-dehydrorhamnose 3,5-epimerase